MKWTLPPAWPSSRNRFQTLLPMWVADMDFPSPPAVTEALGSVVRHGIFGYSVMPDSYVEAVLEWQRRNFSWQPDPNWLLPISGVVSGIKTAIQAFTAPGESVLVQPPVYGHFMNDPVLNGRRVVRAPLRFDGVCYGFDPYSFESAIEPDTKLFLLCNPHNPTGNVWSASELEIMNEICCSKGVIVVSDEIHQDFVFAPSRHTSFASLGGTANRNSVILTSASKTFNLAGLRCANAFIPDEERRGRFNHQLLANGGEGINSFGMVATESAYRHGSAWLNAVKSYIAENKRLLTGALKSAGLPLRVVPSDSLYLLWIDASDFDTKGEPIADYCLHELGIWGDSGTKFQPGCGDFLRLNIACPRTILEQAIRRITGRE